MFYSDYGFQTPFVLSCTTQILLSESKSQSLVCPVLRNKIILASTLVPPASSFPGTGKLKKAYCLFCKAILDLE